jgi:hypothetical protein
VLQGAGSVKNNPDRLQPMDVFFERSASRPHLFCRFHQDGFSFQAIPPEIEAL